MKCNLKKICKEKNISLYKLSKEIDVHNQIVYTWARSRNFPRPKHIDKICTYLNITDSASKIIIKEGE